MLVKNIGKWNTLNVSDGMQNICHYLVSERYMTYDPFPGIYPIETFTYVYLLRLVQHISSNNFYNSTELETV